MKTVAFIINPVSGADQAEAAIDALPAGVEVRRIETTEDDPGRSQTEEALRSEAEAVVACGGDGTVRACIEALIGSDVPLGIVPAGTGNLLAKNLGMPSDPAEAMQCVLDGGRRTLDVGKVNGEAFAIMAGAGLDAEIMSETSRSAKDRFGSAAYVATALRHLGDGEVGCTVSVNGDIVYSGPVATILAANLGKLQGGVELFPDAVDDDGVLDFLAVDAEGVTEWLRSAVDVARGNGDTDRISRWKATDAVIRFDRLVPYQLDGEDRPPTGELQVSAVPSAVTICTPKESV